MVAILHDVVEDTKVTLQDLKDAEFDDVVVSAVDAITKRKGENYMRYISRVKSSKLARIVKLADIAHNMSRAPIPNEDRDKTERRREKYLRAIKALK